ncbi:amino acid permease [Bifidobacterium vansinderenii]|uniref:Amino acid transport protein n=1 Tax=Bifidobacterium vansinderenii TaxID=1984871 RepID=A0A229VWN4_9BIFI|nr:amino acid permease [Bifidobacterium vansinderenii]OXM99819.1 amino acid transport protein [Bifidobacterium vansinderenii]
MTSASKTETQSAQPAHADGGEHAGLQRKMETRHLMMIALGGVIGTGLFLSSGYTIHQAGPIGTILAYAVGALNVYMVMLCLGELATAMPQTGSFHVYAGRFIGPGTGFTVAIIYFLAWMGALGSEFTASGLIMQKWFPGTPAWAWSALFIVLIFTLNALSVRSFAEAEFWFAGIKVVSIIAFIAIGLLAIIGVIPIVGYSHAPGLTNLVKDGVFPNGFAPVFSTMSTVAFAFSGTELLGVTAGETKDPGENIPKAIHTTFWRLAIFFIGSIVVMSALIPWQDAGVDKSPFVLVFDAIGLPFAGDIMNFVVLTAILSAANSGLYASTRMLWSLSNERMIPRIFVRTTKHGVPLIALCTAMIGGLLALLSSVTAASVIYLALVSSAGLAIVIVWVVLAVCEIRFRLEMKREGRSVSELSFHTPAWPIVPIMALFLSVGTIVLSAVYESMRPSLIYMLIIIAICYAVYGVKTLVSRRRNA